VAKAYLERVGDVAELVISAPPLNLLDGQMIGDLEAALDEAGTLARSGAARAVLLRAEGRVLCAGVDVHEFQGLNTGPTAATAVGKRLVQTARDHGVAAADAVTPREVGQVFATRDLPAGLASLFDHGLRRATFEGR
jgi:enoyl-CoA hydratase/carnithine racemase